MKNNPVTTSEWIERILLAVVFLGFGSLIILVFSPWRPMFQDEALDYFGRLGLIGVLAILVALSSWVERLKKFRQVISGLLILAVVVTLEVIFGIYIQFRVNISDATPSGWAIVKVNEALIVVSTILILNKASGNNLGSIYIQKGHLKLGLTIGLIAFGLAAAGSFPMATLFRAQNLTLARVIPWLPWLLLYVLANATMEELMFRGLFLRKLEPFFGKFLSNFLIAFVFTVLHGTVTYSADNMIFVAVTFPLALAWGYIMQRTDSVWGSILFHAGMDIPIMLGIFSGL